MWGSIIGGALGAAGSIFGGMQKNKKIDAQRKYYKKKLQEEENLFNRRYNEDATQRADAQRLLTMTEEAIKRQNKAAEGRRAVMGGTDESVSAEKEAGNKAYADVVSQIAASAADRKDRMEDNFRKTKGEIEGAIHGLDSQMLSGADFASSAIGGALNGVKSFSGIDEYLSRKKKNKKEEYEEEEEDEE